MELAQQTDEINDMIAQIQKQAQLNKLLYNREKIAEHPQINLEENHQELTCLPQVDGDLSDVLMDFEYIEVTPLASSAAKQQTLDEETQDLSPKEFKALKKALRKQVKKSVMRGKSFHFGNRKRVNHTIFEDGNH